MRRLTIRREKAFAACLMKVNFYITSSALYNGDEEVTIGGEQCRKLGELKNGEEKTFLVEEVRAKVFASYNMAGSNIWDEITIPEGREGIRICGKCMFAPSVGNPFNFHEQIHAENY